MRIYYSQTRLCERMAISRVLNTAIAYLGQPRAVAVQLSMVDEDTIRQLNSRDRGIDKATDVLSYPYLSLKAQDKVDGSSDVDMSTGRVMLGDIIICRNIAIQQADSYGHSVTRELCYLAVHSLLHLLGYDHIDTQDEQLMSATADSIMKKAGINR